MTMLCTLLAAAVSCVEPVSQDELARFGYRDFDLAETNLVFFSTAEATTNWVPARLLRVAEDYEWSADEKALVAAAGVVTPCEPLSEIPAGYAKRYDEPWFTGWERPAEAFGFKGVVGMQTHYNEDAGRWDTGETYFSSYWADEAGARAALAELGRRLVGDYRAQKLHEFPGAWIAEYVRLLAMGVVGRTADGRWSCMLTFRDKSRIGCGEWTGVDEQRRRLARFRYGKELRDWKTAVSAAVAANHAAVESARTARGLVGPSEQSVSIQGEDELETRLELGEFAFAPTDATAFTNEMNRIWSERLAAVGGGAHAGLAEEQACPPAGVVRGVVWTNELYMMRLDMLFPSARPDGSGQGPGRFRVIFVERLQPGIEMPLRPALKP